MWMVLYYPFSFRHCKQASSTKNNCGLRRQLLKHGHAMCLIFLVSATEHREKSDCFGMKPFTAVFFRISINSIFEIFYISAVFMYVCMYACMYVCIMWVCMYVCM